jgi:hypothetical protein
VFLKMWVGRPDYIDDGGREKGHLNVGKQGARPAGN